MVIGSTKNMVLAGDNTACDSIDPIDSLIVRMKEETSR